ncbi:sugar ABC transporter permease [Alkalispirochaeta sphaeroplastigenens]|uniref:Sugar ABC transporter permease n=2 Tax=Alkalispirochaeta TaxID=2024958 RepID=A0A2S4JRT6_9SPIO|nr:MULTISPECIES: sugar ABC transporter permease [Alkalispirochaeta]POR02202.1 sugar ABC transporter permease [Alkalispirochaeta sphaeroplastigenens]
MNKDIEYRWLRAQYRFAPVYFLAPALFLFTVFVLWPVVQSFWISLHHWSGFGPMTWAGLANYERLLGDDRFHISLANNIRWLVVMMLAPLGGLALALFLNQNIRGIRMIKSLFFFPFVINLVVIGLVFSWFYNPDLGLLAAVFRSLGLRPIPVLAHERLATYAVIAANLWPQTAYCMILYLTGLTSMNAQVVEAARIDGAAGLKMLWHVIIPQLRGASFVAFVVTIVGALRSFDLIAIMTGGGPWGRTNVLAYQMYNEALFNFNMGYGAAIAVVLFLIMSIFIALFLRTVVKNER